MRLVDISMCYFAQFVHHTARCSLRSGPSGSRSKHEWMRALPIEHQHLAFLITNSMFLCNIPQWEYLIYGLGRVCEGHQSSRRISGTRLRIRLRLFSWGNDGYYRPSNIHCRNSAEYFHWKYSENIRKQENENRTKATYIAILKRMYNKKSSTLAF